MLINLEEYIACINGAVDMHTLHNFHANLYGFRKCLLVCKHGRAMLFPYTCMKHVHLSIFNYFFS